MTSARRPLVFALLALLAVALMGLDVVHRFSIDTSMEHFLPKTGERKLYRISRELIDSRLTSRMVLTIGLDDPSASQAERREKLRGVVKQLHERVARVDGIQSVTSGPPKGIEEAFFELYFPRRFAFFSLQPEADARLRFTPRGLDQSSQRLKEKLGSTEGVFVRNLAPRDPWLLFYDFVTKAGGSSLRLDVEGEQFFAKYESSREGAGQDFAVLFIELRDSALDATAQAPLLSHLEAIERDIRASSELNLVFEKSGANRFAVATERSMKSDIERVFALSTFGLLLLFLVFFRSLARLAFLLLPIAIGLLTALFVSLTLRGSVHALTLAFGGALIGVAIDYPVHALCHLDLGEAESTGPSTMKRLLPTLGLAAGTTILGLFGLAWAPFPGIREIAIFSGVGIATALLVTVSTGRFLHPAKKSRRTTEATSLGLLWVLHFLQRNRMVPSLLLVVAAGLTMTGFATIRFAPGLESLAPLDPALLSEDERVQARLGQIDAGTLAVAIGSDVQEALEKNEQAEHLLSRAKEDGLLSDFENVSVLLRSVSLQKRAHREATSFPDLEESTLLSLEKNGFVRQGFADLQSELKQPLAPLTHSQLKSSPLEPLLSPFILELEGEIAIVSPLSGIQNRKALQKRLESKDGIYLFSQKRMLNQAYEDLRDRTIELLLAGLCLIFVAGLLRYRNLRQALSLFLPAVLAAGGTVGLLSLVGLQLNILHILGLLLVCSMGVDYSVFLIDTKKHPRSALLSIAIGCLSTMMSFGALGLSSAPALRALGITISVGIALALLLAPSALVFLPRRTLDDTI